MRISGFVIATLLTLGLVHATEKPAKDAKAVKPKANTGKAQKAKAKISGTCEEDCGDNAKAKTTAPRTQK